MINSPYKGVLKNLILNEPEKFKNQIIEYKRIILTNRQVCDLELLLNGGYSPLEGYLNIGDYNRVLDEMKLSDGTFWPIPITLDVNKDNYEIGEKVVLADKYGNPLAILTIESIYEPNKEKEAQKVFGAFDKSHIGVKSFLEQTKDVYLGGKLQGISLPKRYDFIEHRHTPDQLRKMFERKKAENIIGFQTRNPMHKAHYELVKRANEKLENSLLLINPVVGPKIGSDIDYVTRVKTYKVIRNKLKNSVLSLLPYAMRMAGPKEALLHAVIRKNYGCTHFIVGRNHAAPVPGKNGQPFYHEDEAVRAVEKYKDEIGIEPVIFEKVVYDAHKKNYVLENEISHPQNIKNISGTEFRELLYNGKDVPEWFSFPEVIFELRKKHPPKHKAGLTIFFTGLSGSGKTTLANILNQKLREIDERVITMLDGDIVRKDLFINLGFTKKDRDINIKIIGYIAGQITKNRGIAICSAIAPYDCSRKYNRDLISQHGTYIEIHVATPLAICEQRDVKGLYAKARAGRISNFTGIDDPYEKPIDSEIIIDTQDKTPEQCIDQILNYLKEKEIIKYGS